MASVPNAKPKRNERNEADCFETTAEGLGKLIKPTVARLSDKLGNCRPITQRGYSYGKQ
jgi:hypothetical protein